MKSATIKKTCMEAEFECNKAAINRIDEKVNLFMNQMNSMEEKFVNLTQVIKLLQKYAETQEQEMGKLRDEFLLAKSKVSDKKLQSEIICPESRKIVFFKVHNL